MQFLWVQPNTADLQHTTSLPQTLVYATGTSKNRLSRVDDPIILLFPGHICLGQAAAVNRFQLQCCTVAKLWPRPGLALVEAILSSKTEDYGRLTVFANLKA